MATSIKASPGGRHQGEAMTCKWPLHLPDGINLSRTWHDDSLFLPASVGQDLTHKTGSRRQRQGEDERPNRVGRWRAAFLDQLGDGGGRAWVSKGLISFPRTSSAARIAVSLNVSSPSALAASTRPSPPGRASRSARRLPVPVAAARRRGESVSCEAASLTALRRVRGDAMGRSTQLSAPRRLAPNRVIVTGHLEANPFVEPGRGEVGHLRSDHQGARHLHPRAAQTPALCLSAKDSHRCLPALASARFLVWASRPARQGSRSPSARSSGLRSRSPRAPSSNRRAGGGH